MKIGIYAWWNVTWNGREIKALGTHIRYLRHFLSQVASVRLFTTIKNTQSLNVESLIDPGLEVINIPWNSWQSVWLHLRQLRGIFENNLDGLDAMYIRLFDPCAWLLAPLCKARGINILFHIVGDPIAGIFQRNDLTWVGKWMRRLLFWPEEYMVLRILRSTPNVMINGGKLTEVFRRKRVNGKTIISSTLEESDFFERDDTCTQNEPVIIYVGFIRPPKRLDILIDAIAYLIVREKRNLRLRIIGPSYPEGFKELLKKRALEQGVGGKIDFVGYIPFGEQLNAQYRMADIFAFPSVTEGSPRVLLDAAANSLPIVTTDVGSVCDLFIHGESALIVPPNDSCSMAEAITRYLDDQALRRSCIRGAHDIAKKHTTSIFIKTIVTQLQ